MGQLEDVHVFIRVVEAGGISKAADQLNIAKSAVSRRLSELESRVQTKLIQRTTRRFHLTEEGRVFYEKATHLVAAFDELQLDLIKDEEHLKGRLTVSIPLSFGIRHMYKAIDAFRKKYPDVTLNIDLSDREVNMVEDGIDVAFRIGELQDSSLQARKIMPIDLVMAASPEYLSAFSENPTIDDVNKMTFLRYSPDPFSVIKLMSPKGEQETVTMQWDLQSNNGDFLLQMAVLGHGVILMPEFICGKELASGQLVPLLKPYRFHESFAYAVYPQNKYLSKNSRVFIDHLVEFYREKREWETY